MSQKPHAPAPRIADAVPLRPITKQQDLSGSPAERRDTYALIPQSSRSYSIHTGGRKAGTVVETVRGTGMPGSQKQEPCWRASLYDGRRADAASPEAALRDVLGIKSCKHHDKVTSYGTAKPGETDGEPTSEHTKVARQPRACASCRFWDPSDHKPGFGRCRISAPVDHKYGCANWPSTAETDWCGMYQHDRRGAQPEESR